MQPTVHVTDLGTRSYQEVWHLQQQLQQKLIAEKKEHSHSETGYLLFVEHPHVYTLGKSGKWENLLFTEDILKQKEVDTVKTDRGGDITYHGPGQIVGYPILDLEQFGMGVAHYIESLEEVIIRTAEHFGVTAQRVPGRTGVWVQNNKLCALGIKCSRYVSMHGFALNVSTQLEYYNGIIPCGIEDGGVTSFSRLLKNPPDREQIKKQLVTELQHQFDCKIVPINPDRIKEIVNP